MAKGGWRAGAGRRTQRPKVTDCRAIDVRHFQQDGALRHHWTGSWGWWDTETLARTFKVNVWSWIDQVWLQFVWQNQQVEETIQIERTSCFFGGTRPWFSCPGCQRRVAVLYLHDGGFRCRRCHDLRYLCQSEDAIDRTWRAQGKAERKIGPTRSRPKGMHKVTYERLVERIANAEHERRMLMNAGYRRLLELE